MRRLKMHFEILREQNLKDENRVKLKIKVEAPLRKTADVPYIVFNDQQKVVDFIIEKGYTFDRWTCLKAGTVHNRGDESSRVKTWSFSLERFPKATVQEKPKISLQNYFGNYTIFSIEELIFEKIDYFDTDFKFKGFIDLVIKTDDGKYHIIDWKTCSWGWRAQKKSDPMVVYQLSLYKKFFSDKHNIPFDNIETHFILLKRTAKKDNVEVFRVSNKKKRVANALNSLEVAIVNIKAKNFVKNKLSCKYCEFKNTKHCP